MEKRRWERPRTRMTGVRPRRAQVRVVGGVIEKPASSSKRSQASSTATDLPPAARSPSPSPPRPPRRARWLGGWDLVAEAVPVQHPRDRRQRHRRPISVLIRASVHVWSGQACAIGPLASSCSSTMNRASLSLGRDTGPADRSPSVPASRQARRQRCPPADISHNRHTAMITHRQPPTTSRHKGQVTAHRTAGMVV